VIECMAPNYAECRAVDALEMPSVKRCYLDRPGAAAMYQPLVEDGWLTFTKCVRVNMETMGGL